MDHSFVQLLANKAGCFGMQGMAAVWVLSDGAYWTPLLPPLDTTAGVAGWIGDAVASVTGLFDPGTTVNAEVATSCMPALTPPAIDAGDAL